MHEFVLDVADRLDDERLAWRPGLQAPSAAFHLWHLARFADRLQARLPGLTPALRERLGPGQEAWEAEGLATRWGLGEGLGYGNTGMQLADAMSAALTLPGKDVLLDYARRTFARADRAVSSVEESQMPLPCKGLTDNETVVGDVLLGYLAHVGRHLGMIEALAGVQGVRGTATV
jgi:hypothetical protein